MATLGEWTRDLLDPAPMPSRPRWLHWIAWLASIASFAILAVPVLFGRAGIESGAVAQIDLWISVAFAAEFFTRSGFRREGWTYARWRWFDFLAMVPVLFIEQFTDVYAWVLWVVLFARLGRMVDRTLGDGFVKRHALALVEAVEEEISDRVLLKIMSRIEAELAQAKFGEAAAGALARNKDAILERIYAEQQPETGALARLANLTRLQSAVEKMEARVFDAIVDVVGSGETDALIKEVMSQSLARARAEISQRSWRTKVGLRSTAPVATPAPGAHRPAPPRTRSTGGRKRSRAAARNR